MKLKICFFFFLFFAIKINAQNDSIYIKKLFEKADGYMQTNRDSALVVYNKILKISEKNNYHIFSGRANIYVGSIYVERGEYDLGVLYYEKAKVNYKNLNHKSGIATCNINIGNVSQYIGDFSGAIPYYLDGISAFEELENDFRLSVSYGNLANIFETIGQLKEAKESYNKSIFFARKLKDSSQLSYSLYNLSSHYVVEEKYDSVFFYLKESKRYLIESSENDLKSLVSSGEARYYLNRNETKIALKNANEALFYVNKTKDPYYLAIIQLLIGEIYLKQNKLEIAINYTLKSLEIAKKNDHKSTLIDVYSQLYEISKIKNNSEDALHYKELQDKYKDIVLNEKQKNNVNYLNIKYETEKKNKEIIQQQLELAQNKNELQKRKTKYNYMTGAAISLLLTSLLLWFSYQQRKKRKDQEILALTRAHQVKTLESLMEGEEKERFRIAKELHDGVNGDLSAIKYKLTSLLEKNNAVINEAVTMIDKSCEHVRAISHNLIPPALEKFSLIEAVEGYCATVNDIHKPEITFQHIGEEIKISKKEEVNIFRVIQEMVTNSIKHAEATEINVQISNRDNNLQITVEDNGKGFNKDEVKSNGIGLSNIQSRVDYLNARLDFVSNEKGTSYTIEIDINKLNDH